MTDPTDEVDVTEKRLRIRKPVTPMTALNSADAEDRRGGKLQYLHQILILT